MSSPFLLVAHSCRIVGRLIIGQVCQRPLNKGAVGSQIEFALPEDQKRYFKNVPNKTVNTKTFSLLSLVFMGFLSIALFPRIAFAQSITDNFNRANGPLGPSWTDITDGGLAISSQVVIGTSGLSGDIRTGEAYTSDHYSQIEVTSTQLTGGQWIGPAVRLQNGGQNGYVGIYYWNNGTPVVMLFKRSGSSSWTQLGNTYNGGALAAGTQLEVTATGSTISFLENGVAEIIASDTSFTGGAPGIMAYGTATAGDWAGGNIGSTGTYSIGGAVTGLSGTLVLQDINGDALSVS